MNSHHKPEHSSANLRVMKWNAIAFNVHKYMWLCGRLWWKVRYTPLYLWVQLLVPSSWQSLALLPATVSMRNMTVVFMVWKYTSTEYPSRIKLTFKAWMDVITLSCRFNNHCSNKLFHRDYLMMSWCWRGDMPSSKRRTSHVNPLHAKLFRGNINIYLHFIAWLHIDMTHILKILLQVRPGPIYST